MDIAMFGKQKAQPKEAYEQPEIQVGEVSGEERNPPYHEVIKGENMTPLYVNGRVRCYEPNPSIISKVRK